MSSQQSDIGLYGLAVMGQNFALNMAEHGFQVSVCNRSPAKVCLCLLFLPLSKPPQELYTHIYVLYVKYILLLGG